MMLYSQNQIFLRIYVQGIHIFSRYIDIESE